MYNPTAKIIRWIGFGTIILGLIGSIVLATSRGMYGQTEFNFVTFLTSFVDCFVSGMMFIGVSEVIALLQHSVTKQAEILKLMQDKQEE